VAAKAGDTHRRARPAARPPSPTRARMDPVLLSFFEIPHNLTTSFEFLIISQHSNLTIAQPHNFTTPQPHNLITSQPPTLTTSHNLTLSEPPNLTTSQPQKPNNLITGGWRIWQRRAARVISSAKFCAGAGWLHPSRYTPNPGLHTLHPKPWTLHSTPYTLSNNP